MTGGRVNNRWLLSPNPCASSASLPVLPHDASLCLRGSAMMRTVLDPCHTPTPSQAPPQSLSPMSVTLFLPSDNKQLSRPWSGAPTKPRGLLTDPVGRGVPGAPAWVCQRGGQSAGGALGPAGGLSMAEPGPAAGSSSAVWRPCYGLFPLCSASSSRARATAQWGQLS